MTSADTHIAQAVDAIRISDKQGAVAHLNRAMQALENAPNERDRRDRYVAVANWLLRLGEAMGGLEAARAAVAVDEAMEDRNLLGQDILLVGTAVGTLGNLHAAEQAYRDARQIFIDDENWANAASATTNIAVLIGQDDIDAGIDLLEESLVFLSREEFPATEITTRIALIQALALAERPGERVFEIAATLFERFWDELRPDQKQSSVGPLEQVMARHFSTTPVADEAGWKATRFPAAYG